MSWPVFGALKRSHLLLRRSFVTSVLKTGYNSTRAATTNKPIMFAYPTVRRDETVVDDYHGTKIADPYRHLEDPDAPETKAFVEAQNALSLPFIHASPVRENFQKRMTKLYDFPKYGCPFKRGDHYFFYYNTGLQNHSVLYVQASLDAEQTVLLDPNTFSEDGTTALHSTSFTEDGRFVAYSVSAKGSDWETIKVRSVETGQDLSDELKWVKFSCLSWTHDNKGFFYNRYPVADEMEDKDMGTETTINLFHKLYYHRIGTPQSEDVLCFEMPENPKWMSGLEVTDDGQYFLLFISEGCEPVNRLYFAPAQPVTGLITFTKVVDNFEAQYDYVSNDGTVFTFKTNLNAPRYRVIRADLAKLPVVWEDVIPQSADVLEWSAAVNTNQLVLCYLHHVRSVLQVHSLTSGAHVGDLPLEVGSVSGYSGRRRDAAIFYKFTSFLVPGTIYHCDLATMQPKLFRQTEIAGFDSSLFETQQVFVTSKDGVKFPMFIIARKGLERTGAHPTLLYGYGGFNISMTPSFSVSRVIFCQNLHGVMAVANIRGGGEYGIEWHKGGSLGNKQNCFNDFQSAAEYLVREGFTTTSKLAINGGSNGGLLVAACANQRPDLFGCVLANVGVMDMLRFHRFTIGHAWTTDYGCADNAEQFPWLRAYSPVHNIRPADVPYPATLVMTGDHDDRVVPLHSLKYIATLQHTLGALAQQTNPLMARIEVKAGHGAGKPTTKIIEEVADMYAFMSRTLGFEWHDD
eukprot:m.19194 g.19194  ORF g.19194 m.19194 type:complete len:743 (+) comp7533_c1_seq1:1353-3581(+)